MSWAAWSSEVKWLEVSFQVRGEFAEPIAELLSRVAPDGVAVGGTTVDAPADQASAAVLVRGWLPDDHSLDERKRKLEEGLWHLGQIHPLPRPTYREIEASDWSDAWRDSYQPIAIGGRLLVTPPWLAPVSDQRIPIVIEPGMAFGTGTHPTTRHCLEALETYVEPQQWVADLGCGTGILAIAAAKLGASQVLALDQDLEAVAATTLNVSQNKVADQVWVQAGSLPELTSELDRRGRRVEILVANLLASTLESMLTNGLVESVEAGGLLVLSGILEDQLDPLLHRSRIAGLELFEVLAEGDWRTPLFKRISPLAS